VTNFLPAGFLKEDIDELREGLAFLRQLVNSSTEEKRAIVRSRARENGGYMTYSQLVLQTIEELAETIEGLDDILSRLPADPIVYTGELENCELIRLLNQLLFQHQHAQDAEKFRELTADD
jgi:hypothetical protein